MLKAFLPRYDVFMVFQKFSEVLNFKKYIFEILDTLVGRSQVTTSNCRCDTHPIFIAQIFQVFEIAVSYDISKIFNKLKIKQRKSLIIYLLYI